MSEQSEEKTTGPVISTSQDAPNDAKQGKGELSEKDLAKVTGGIEQVLNIGSQTSGAGAGKVTFNPF